MQCVTIVIEGNNYVTSNHPKKLNDLIKKANSGSILFPQNWETGRINTLNGDINTNEPLVVEFCLPYIGKENNNFANAQIFDKENLGAADNLEAAMEGTNWHSCISMDISH